MTVEHEISRPGRFWLVFLWGLEVMGVLIGAGSAFSVTFGDRPPDHFLDWFVAAPMVALATIELMRIYLARAFCYHRNILLRLFVVLGLVLCVGVAFENWTIGIERLVDRRFSDIEHKREEVRTIQQKIDDRKQENAARDDDHRRRQGEAAAAVERNTARLAQIDAALKAKAEEHARLMVVIREGCLKIAGPCLVPKQEAELSRYEREARPLREEGEALAAEMRALQRDGREAGSRQFDDGQAGDPRLAGRAGHGRARARARSERQCAEPPDRLVLRHRPGEAVRRAVPARTHGVLHVLGDGAVDLHHHRRACVLLAEAPAASAEPPVARAARLDRAAAQARRAHRDRDGREDRREAEAGAGGRDREADPAHARGQDVRPLHRRGPDAGRCREREPPGRRAGRARDRGSRPRAGGRGGQAALAVVGGAQS